MPETTLRRFFAVLALLAAAASGACSGPVDRRTRPVAPRAQLLIVAPPPELVARSPGQERDVIAATARLTSGNPATVPLRPVDADSVPLLQSAPAGRRFLGLGGDRALAVGTPGAVCPAVAPAAAATLDFAVGAALAACRTQLAEAGAAAECGCRLIAANRFLLAPYGQFAYAPGLSTRVLLGGRLDATRYVAEERLDAAGVAETVIFAGTRPVWRVRALSPTEATVTEIDAAGAALADYPARRALAGLDRGRFRERLTATRPDGTAVTILIGV